MVEKISVLQVVTYNYVITVLISHNQAKGLQILLFIGVDKRKDF